MEMSTPHTKLQIGDFGGKYSNDKGIECVVDASVLIVDDIVVIAEEIFLRRARALKGSGLKLDPGFTWYVGHKTFSSVVSVSYKVPGENN